MLNVDQLPSHSDGGAFANTGGAIVSHSESAQSNYADIIRADYPTGYWRLGEAAVTQPAIDASGNSHNGAYPTTGVTLGQKGTIGFDSDTAAAFAGTSAGGITVGSAADLNSTGTGPFTIEAWVNPNPGAAPGAQYTILAKTHGRIAAPFNFYLRYIGSNMFLPGLDLGDGTSMTTFIEAPANATDQTVDTVPANQWSLVQVTVQPGSGNTAGTRTVTFWKSTVGPGLGPKTAGPALQQAVSPTGGSDPAHIGGTGATVLPNRFNGSLDEIAIYPSVLLAPGNTDPGYDHWVSGRDSPAPNGGVTTGTGVTVCDNRLGLEPWWQYASKPLGGNQTAYVNVSNGNLVVSAQDSTPIQAHGHLAYVLRRAYNSQDTNALDHPGSFGVGWQLNIAQADDLIGDGIGATGLSVSSLEAQAHPTAVTLIDRDGTHFVFQPHTLATTAGDNLHPIAIPATGVLAPCRRQRPARHPRCGGKPVRG